MKNVKWLVRREIDDRFLCTDNKWRDCVAGVENIKLYKRPHAAQKALDRFAPLVEDGHFETRGTLYAVHEGDTIDRNGKITRSKAVEPLVGENRLVVVHKVGYHHVAEPYLKVCREIYHSIRKSVRNKMTRPLRRGLFKLVIETHRANRAVYLQVMKG